MSKILSLITLLGAPGADSLPRCDVANPVKGAATYCCAQSNGQQCCAGKLGDGGKPEGCGC